MANVAVSDKVYKENLLNTIFSFCKDGLYTDITLTLKYKEITAHRVILAAASEVFAAMLQVDMKEKFEGKVNLNNFGLKDRAVDELIEYIYTGRLKISVDNVEEMMACANFFMISRLRDDCCDFMANALVPMNSLGILSIATKFGCKKLREKAITVIQEDFVTVINEEEFLRLDKGDLFDLLSNDMIEVPDEDLVFKAFQKWLNFDLENRSKYFEELFPCVRIQFLTESCFSALNLNPYDKLLEEASLARSMYFTTNGAELLPVGNNTLPRRCLDTSIAIMTTGGYDGNSCLIASFVFPLGNNKWGHLAPMLVSRHDHGTVALKNRLFVIGGFNSHKGPLNRGEYFNSIRNEWVEIPPMHFKRKSLGLCVYDDKLFVSGGLDGNYNALDAVEFYDVEKEIWTNFIPMNEPRYSHGFVANSKGLFAIGGWKMTTGERFYDGQWRMIAPLSVPRAGATTIIRNDKIYVFGGYSNARCISTVEVYDIELDSWSSGASSQISRWRAGSAVVDNTIYVIGGRDSSWQYLDTVETYDLDKDQWRQEKSLPCKIMGLQCSVVAVPKHAIR